MIERRFDMLGTLDQVDCTVIALTGSVSATLAAEVRIRVAICVTEVLSNLVKHGQGMSAQSVIDVTMTEDDTAIMVQVFDPTGAAPFDPRDTATDLENLDALAESGRGLGLILTCADGVEYGPQDGRFRLVLTFFKHHATAPNAAQGGADEAGLMDPDPRASARLW